MVGAFKMPSLSLKMAFVYALVFSLAGLHSGCLRSKGAMQITSAASYEKAHAL